MTPRTIKLVAGGAVALAVIVFASIYAGKSWGRAEESGETAKAIATMKRSMADSVKREVLRRDREAEREADSVRKAEAARVVQARLQTDRALTDARLQRAAVAKVLADDAATVAQLRAALASTAATLDAVTATLAAERAATDSALRARDAAHEKQLGAVRKGAADVARADSIAYSALQTGIAAQIRAAEKRGTNKGRLQILGALGTAAVVALLK